MNTYETLSDEDIKERLKCISIKNSSAFCKSGLIKEAIKRDIKIGFISLEGTPGDRKSFFESCVVGRPTFCLIKKKKIKKSKDKKHTLLSKVLYSSAELVKLVLKKIEEEIEKMKPNPSEMMTLNESFNLLNKKETQC